MTNTLAYLGTHLIKTIKCLPFSLTGRYNIQHNDTQYKGLFVTLTNTQSLRKCRYTKCRILCLVMLNVVMLSVIILSVVAPLQRQG